MLLRNVLTNMKCVINTFCPVFDTLDCTYSVIMIYSLTRYTSKLLMTQVAEALGGGEKEAVAAPIMAAMNAVRSRGLS